METMGDYQGQTFKEYEEYRDYMKLQGTTGNTGTTRDYGRLRGAHLEYGSSGGLQGTMPACRGPAGSDPRDLQGIL